jgi:hypothetical protein
MMNEIKQITEDSKKKISDKFKKYLVGEINIKIKISFFILAFIMFNFFMKWITYEQASFNVFLIIIVIIIISFVDGFYKHKELKEDNEVKEDEQNK